MITAEPSGFDYRTRKQSSRSRPPGPAGAAPAHSPKEPTMTYSVICVCGSWLLSGASWSALEARGPPSERRVRCSCGLGAGLRQVQLQFRFCFPTTPSLLAQSAVLPRSLRDGTFRPIDCGERHRRRVPPPSVLRSCPMVTCTVFRREDLRAQCDRIGILRRSRRDRKGRRRLGRHPGEYRSLAEALAVGPTSILRKKC